MAYPPITPDGSAGKRPSRSGPNPLLDARCAKWEAECAFQLANTSVTDGYTIRPAIGRTGGVDNVGWELLKVGYCDRYVGTKADCLLLIAKDRAKELA